MGYDPTGNIDWGAIGRFFAGFGLAIVGGTIALLTFIPAIFSPHATVACEFGLRIGMYGAFMMGSAFDSDIKADMDRIGWNPYNSNADLVTQSTKVSFYKGVPVIRTKMNRSGTFGIMFLAQNEGADAVKHEFGHIIQLMFLGIGRFGLYIGIPSVLEVGRKKYGGYYKQPWETSADMFGNPSGDEYQHTVEEMQRALWYLFKSFWGNPWKFIFS